MIPKGTNTGTVTQDQAYLSMYQLQDLLCFDRTHSRLTLVGGQITGKNVENKDIHTRATQFGFIPHATAEFPRAATRRENSQHRAITSSWQDPVRSAICDGLYDLCTIDERSARAAELLSVRRNVMGRWLCGECLSLVQIGGGRMNVLFLSQRAGGYWVTSVVVEGSMNDEGDVGSS